MKRIEDLPREDLIKLVYLSSELAIAIDGLWFLSSEQAFGFDRALDMDIQVWKRYAKLSLKRIRKHFELPVEGLDAIKQIMRLDPLWLSIEFDLIEDPPDSLIFQVTNCPSLLAMEKMGRETFTCEAVEKVYLTELCKAIDPRIKVEALKLPPRKNSDDICCKWKFYMDSIS